MGRTYELEDDLHLAVAQYLATALHPSVLWFHTPNGGFRHKRSASRLKAMGVLAGVPDLYFAWSDLRHANFNGWIELKSDSGSVSKEQGDFKARVRELGHHWGMTRTVDGVEAYLRDWGVPLRARLT